MMSSITPPPSSDGGGTTTDRDHDERDSAPPNNNNSDDDNKQEEEEKKPSSSSHSCHCHCHCHGDEHEQCFVRRLLLAHVSVLDDLDRLLLLPVEVEGGEQTDVSYDRVAAVSSRHRAALSELLRSTYTSTLPPRPDGRSDGRRRRGGVKDDDDDDDDGVSSDPDQDPIPIRDELEALLLRRIGMVGSSPSAEAEEADAPPPPAARTNHRASSPRPRQPLIGAEPKPEPKEQARARHVRVGVGVLVRDPRDPTKVFAGVRKGSHGAGTLALPGGHLEMGESWSDCAIREVMEETGLILDPTTVTFVHVTNDPMMDEDTGKHYVTIFMGAECECANVADADGGCGGGDNAVPRTLEPDKCEGWHSYDWTDLVDALALAPADDDGGAAVRLFGPLRRLVEERPPALLAFLGVEVAVAASVERG